VVSLFRKAYGASPLHLLAVVASFAIAGYGFFMIFKSPAPESTLIYFGFAVIAHDMIAFPLYSGLNFIAGGTTKAVEPESVAASGVPAINYLRVPFLVSAISLVMFFPLVFGLSADRYEANTGLDPGVFLGRWLGICAVVFTVSAILYAVKLRRYARSGSEPAEG
jgi:hypothetical protein